MEHSALCYDSVASLAARYRSGELSPVQVTESALVRSSSTTFPSTPLCA